MWQLFQFPLCPFSRKVRLVLGEKGGAPELVRENPGERRDEFIEQNPARETPVLVDSGVRRGVDIVKAIALGAQAVAIGRATLYGAAAGGEAGAERALAILTDELRRAMQLCGTPRVRDIDARLLQERVS